MKAKYVYQLKPEFRVTQEFRKEIRVISDIFYMDDHKFLKGVQLPKNTKTRIDTLWWNSPISKIQYGFRAYAMAELELDDLLNDPFCKGHSNKTYWIKTYMMDWLCNLPDVLDINKAFSILMGRTAHRLLVSSAYAQVEVKYKP